MPERYLVDIPEREHEAIRRFFNLPGIHEQLFGALGLKPSFSWYLLEVRGHHFTGSLPSEIDILAGLLNRSDSGGFNWPPLTNYLVGIEVKCAYLSPEAKEISLDTIKSKKSSQKKMIKIKSKIRDWLKTGFNKVVLLDVIANPPVSNWILAMNVATASMEALSPILKKRLPLDSPAGHWVWPIGSLSGGNETTRGASSLIELKIAQENPLLQGNVEVQSQRQEMESKLSRILANLPSPYGPPVILIDCRACGRIHSREDACNYGEHITNN